MTQQQQPTDPDDDALVREALDWFLRLQLAADDPSTGRAFRAWLECDPRHGEAFEKVATFWGAPEFMQASRNVAKATGFRSPRKRSRARARKIAAVATVAVLAIGAWKAPDWWLAYQADYITATGQQQAVSLPDGSRMILNTGSAVALDFAGQRRNVRVLKGEAYFDVKPNAALFQVAGRFGRVEVRGTAFTVKRDDAGDRVVLGRGRVEVARLDAPQDRTPLVPGEATSVTSGAVATPAKIDAQQSMAWLDGRIDFHDAPLGEVLDDLGRYYAGRIVVLNPALRTISVSGSYRLDQPLSVVQSLAAAAGATMTQLPGGLIVLR